MSSSEVVEVSKEMSQQIIDQSERLEALDPAYSFIVQAPAGSGKTGLLTQRFLGLLANASDAPEQCLAITFTRKAAAEMRERVLNALLRANDPTPPSGTYEFTSWELAKKIKIRDKALGWDIENNPSRLKIQTIDALCLSITRQMPVVSEFGSPPQVTEDASALYKTAAKNLLKGLETDEPWSSAVSTLLEHLDNHLQLAETLLAALLPHRDQWLPYIGHTRSLQQARTILESNLQGVVLEILNHLVKSVPTGFEDIGELAQFAATNCERNQNKTKKTNISACKMLTGWPGSGVEDLEVWRGLTELLLTQDYTFRKTVTEQQGFPAPSGTKDKADKLYFQTMKARMNDYLLRLADFPNFRENLQYFYESPPLKYTQLQWTMVETLVQLLPILTAQLSLVFQEEGQVDFVEVSLSALKALGNWDSPTDLALGLDYKLRHILVDEFQDTSLTQFRLLEQLTAGWQLGDGRTLFLVGDPMQSIYRFRQAEVGLFLRAKQKGVGSLCLKSLTLKTNFRSELEIVEWSNQMFGKLFPQQDDIASSAITYSHSKAARALQTKITVVQASETLAQIETVTIETEANRVVELVKSLKEKEPTAKNALLVRSRSHLQRILPALREAQIEYQGVQLELLCDHPIVQDLLSLTQALLHLGNRIAWLALLRAPWCSLSFKDCWVIANYAAPNIPIWHSLEALYTSRDVEHSELSLYAKNRLAFIVPVLSHALSEQGRLSLRAWVLKTWLALEGATVLKDQNSLQDAEAFFSILDEEKKLNFYEVGVLEKRLQSLFAKPNMASPDALQIMTIHKAKGLEFDTVIVPGVGKKVLGDPSKLLLWETRAGLLQESYLVLAPIQSVGAEKDPIYNYLRKQEERRAKHEMMRLWYVAATRAKKRLYWLTYDPDVWQLS